MDMPNDAAMLLSLVNMKLRDGCPSPEELCCEQDWDCEELYRRNLIKKPGNFSVKNIINYIEFLIDFFAVNSICVPVV